MFGNLADTFLQPRLFRLPGAAAKPVQQPLFVTKTGQQFDIFDRQIQLCFFGIFQQQAFMRRAQRRDHLKPEVASDPMINMDHQIAGGQAVDLGQEVFGAAAFLGAADQSVAQNVLFRNDRQAGGFEPVLQWPNRQMQAGLADAGVIRHRHRFDPAFVFDQSGQTLSRAIGIRGDDHGAAFK